MTGTIGGSNKMLTSTEVGELLKLPERTIRLKAADWGLPVYRIGRGFRIRERDLTAWIDRQAA
jgi:excisionase family DNA binding protein